MKRYLLLGLVFSLLCAISPVYVEGQDRVKSGPSVKEQSPLRELNLTEEQQNAIKKIKVNYINKVVRLRNELAVKQLEFRNMIGEPATSEEAIRTRGREIEAINGQIMREMIGYEIEVRRILTAEQLRTWYSNMDSPVQKTWGKYP